MAGLGLYTARILVAFGATTLISGRRATHGLGVGGAGRVKIVDHPEFPEHEFFRAGREFPVRLRHANVQVTDDAGLDVRGASLKFSEYLDESPMDLLMNTGEASIFNTADVFWQTVKAGTITAFTKKYDAAIKFFAEHPLGMTAEQGSIRRAPGTYTQLYFYSKLAYAFTGADGVMRYVKYRLIPEDRSREDGLPSEEDQKHPWEQGRLPDNTNAPDYLRQELKDRLARQKVVYHLQLQLHDVTDDEEVLNSSIPWDVKKHPWMDLATVTIDRVLPDQETERLRYNIINQPDSLGLLESRSPHDYNSVAALRAAAYRWIQRIRFLRL